MNHQRYTTPLVLSAIITIILLLNGIYWKHALLSGFLMALMYMLIFPWLTRFTVWATQKVVGKYSNKSE